MGTDFERFVGNLEFPDDLAQFSMLMVRGRLCSNEFS